MIVKILAIFQISCFIYFAARLIWIYCNPMNSSKRFKSHQIVVLLELLYIAITNIDGIMSYQIEGNVNYVNYMCIFLGTIIYFTKYNISFIINILPI